MMILFVVAALAALAGAAKLDRTYLPPASSATAGGSPGSLQAPFRSADHSSSFLQTPLSRTSEVNPSFRVPSGGYENEYQGVVVDAAAAGPRTADRPSGLGGPRVTYGSNASKVGEAAFRGTGNQAGAQPTRGGPLDRAPQGQYEASGLENENNPDLSAFHQPPASSKPQIQIVRDPVSNTIKYQNDIGLDKFKYAFETENGIKMEGNGVSADGVRTQGGYSYTGDDGRLYSVQYTADEAGYQPVGAHLPTPPPVPAHILLSLEQNARDEAGGLSDDGSYDAQKYNTDDDYTKSDANGKYNDKQSNKFWERPGSGAAPSGTIVDQNKKDLVEPNDNGRFSAFDSSKDRSLETSKLSSLGSDNKANEKNALDQNRQNYQFNNNRFGPQFQYLPPVGNGQRTSTFPGLDSSKDGKVSDFNVSPNQKLQVPGIFEIPAASFTGPNHYGSPVSEPTTTPTSKDKLSLPSQGTSTFGITESPLSHVQTLDGKQYHQLSENTNSPDRGISFQSGSPSLTGFQSPSDFNSNAETSFGDSSPARLSTSIPNFDVNPVTTTIKYTGNVPVLKPNSDFAQNIPNGDSEISEQAVSPTKKPQFTITSPIENQGSSIFPDSNKPKQSLFTTFPTSTSINTQAPTSSLSMQSNTQAGLNKILAPQFRLPTHSASTSFNFPSSSDSNKFNGQTQGPDDSYVYDKPLKPFNTPSDRPFSASDIPFFTNTPPNSLISAQQQGQPEFSKYPHASFLNLIKPTIATRNEDEDNLYQTNGVTQASISPFPSIVPTSSSVFFTTPTLLSFPEVGSTIATAPTNFISTNLEDQKYNAASQSQLGQRPLETGNKPTYSGSQAQKYNGEVYEYNKPNVELLASPQKQNFEAAKFNNTPQFVQAYSQKFSSSQLNQQPKPSHPEAQTGSKLNFKTTPTQIGIKTGSPFDQPTTPPRINDQTGSPFRQKSTQSRFGLQTSPLVGPQFTPSRFGFQIRPSFGQQTIPPRFSDKTSPSFGQQTLPSRFGIQTSSSVGPQPTLSVGAQSATLFGQKTPPSRFGVQISPSFGYQSTPTRFGSLTGLSFGQQTTPAPFGVEPNSLFGQQTTLSRFGLQSRPLFGQKTSPAQFGIQTHPTHGQQSAVMRFGEQTGTSVEQGIFRFDPKKQTGQQSLSKVSQNENLANANQKNFAQEIKTKPDSFNSKSLPSFQSAVQSLNKDFSSSTGADRIYNYNMPSTIISTDEGTQANGQQPTNPLQQVGQQPQRADQLDQQNLTGQQINYIAPDRQKVVTQASKEFDNTFPSNLGTQTEKQINAQSDSSFQKEKNAQPVEQTQLSSKQVNSQVPQSIQKFDSNRVPPETTDVSEFQSGVNFQNQNAQKGKVPQTTFTQENLSNLKPFGSLPQFSFQSACCGGSTNQNQGFLQNLSGDGYVKQPNTSLGDLGFNKKENQGLKEPQTGSQGPTGNLYIRPQSEPTRSNAGKGEQFGGPRTPPSFDATGYHY